MIKLENVSKKFANKIAVNDLSLEIQPGEIFAFLGPNGAGKTTTIKMLVGLLKATSGKLYICGHDLDQDSLAAKSVIAYVPDHPYLYDKLTGREFLQFVARMYQILPKDMAHEIDRYSEMFETREYLDELTENYSHGMKQRVVFSSALIHSPKVLIIDEPMVGLDPKSVRIVKNILKEQAKNQATIFMSTHSLDIAEETATKIGIISKGTLLVVSTLSELQAKLQREARLEEIFMEMLYEGKTS